MNKKKWLTVVMGTVLVIGACSPEEADEVSEGGSSEVENGEQELSDEEAFPVTVEDARGQEITIEEQPDNVISLLPSNTELIYGLDAWDQLQAVTSNDDYPEKASELPSVGDMVIDVEAVIANEPDLVLAGAINDPEALNQIESAGIQVVVIEDTNTFEDFYRVVSTVGEVLGKNDEAGDLIASFEEEIERIEKISADIPEEDRVSVWVEVGADPDLFTTGSGTFVNEMLDVIGADNVAGDQEGWVQFTEEDAVTLNPDVIILTYGAYVEDARGDVLNRSAWQSIPAVEHERVYELEDSNIVTRQGPRLIEGVETLAKFIYPDHY
ncbi:ABC transporter substrate-binding protein [Bacillus sp. H-16]|uniref:ABC transporter substrate-binding protein n=1 Tax=Alteribacter salitolerans TaxID=2912333 RepID=UPI001962790A|nr:ABC transporter substrate-binding protein [Alteribacter salitolerans]MBM7094704.1 ABC transporter substrate-binding protein [Alteribacter salitolerans]